jgi:four helix bundle protein
MQDFRKLKVWQASRPLTVAVYKLVRQFPVEERYGLAAQLRSSVTSIGANIAEGFGRATPKDTARCLQISVGSGCETLHHLYTALDLGYITESEFNEVEDAHLGPVRRMLTNLLFKVRARPRQIGGA